MSPSPLIGPLLQGFFAEHLMVHKRVSPQTVAAYRDAFRLLLDFVRRKTGTEPSVLRIVDLDAPIVLAFLDHLERGRNNAVRSRNLRLTAVRSFFRYVALREPGSLDVATRVLAIPVKRTDRKIIGYLTRMEMEALIAAPDRSRWAGRRDHALLITLYNSGARVSEVTGLRRSQLVLGTTSFVQLSGKGQGAGRAAVVQDRPRPAGVAR